jgi:hypothetical protein
MVASKFPEDTTFRVGLIFAAIIGALSIVGTTVMWFPELLLLVAFFISIWELLANARKHQWHAAKTRVCVILLIGVFAWLAYVTWFVFKVNMQVRFITGAPSVSNGINGEHLRFAVKLTNVGRATSLTSWEAFLLMPDGTKVRGEITNQGETVDITGSDRLTTKYILPDCDLVFQTVRAVQTGDSVYGIVTFWFKIPPQSMPLDTLVQLEATDMLGKRITDEAIKFADINSFSRDIFPCRSKQ